MIELRSGLNVSVVSAVYEALLYSALPHIDWFGVQQELERQEWCISLWEAEICIGAIYGRAGDMHLVIRDHWHSRWCSRRLLTQFFDWYFSIYPYAIIGGVIDKRVLKLARFMGFQFALFGYIHLAAHDYKRRKLRECLLQ